MTKTFWSVVLVLSILLTVGCIPLTATENPSEDTVLALCVAIQNKEIQTVLSNDYVLQRNVALVRANEPKFAQESKIQKLYSGAEVIFKSEDFSGNRYRDLKYLLSFSPKISVLEIKPIDLSRRSMPEFEPNPPTSAWIVYVKLTYSNRNNAPDQGVTDNTGVHVTMKKLKEAVVKIGYYNGQFFSAERSTEYNEYWPADNVGASPVAAGESGEGRREVQQRGESSAPEYPISSGRGVTTQFGVSNDTLFRVSIFLDGSEAPIVIKGSRAYISSLEVGSTHMIKAVVEGRTFQLRFTVPRVMNALRVTSSGIQLQ